MRAGTVEIKIVGDSRQFDTTLQASRATTEAFADQAGKKLSQASKSFASVTAAAGLTRQETQALEERMKTGISADVASKALDKLTKQANLSASEIADLEKRMGLAAKMVPDVSASFGNFEDVLKKGIAYLASFKIALEGLRLGKDLVTSATETAAGFEQLQVSLKTISGSSSSAHAAMNWIVDFAKDTPFQLDEVANAFKRLSSLGIDPTTYLKPLGDVAASMGTSLDQAVEAFADAITGEYERLKEFGVRASTAGDQVTFSWQENGKQLTSTVNNTQSGISSALLQVFNRFKGGMQDQMGTFNGMMSNLHDTWTQSQNTFMNSGPFQAMKDSLKKFLEYLNSEQGRTDLDQWLETTASVALSTAQAITGGLLAVSVGFDSLRNSGNGLVYLFAKVWQSIWSVVSILPDFMLPEGFAYKAKQVSLQFQMMAADAEIAVGNTEELQDKVNGAFTAAWSQLDKLKQKIEEAKQTSSDGSNSLTFWDTAASSVQSLAASLAQAQPAAQSFASTQESAFQDTSDSLQALKDNLQGYYDLLNSPSNFSSPFDDQVPQSSGSGSSTSAYGSSTGQYVTTVEIPHSLANERYWYYGTVNGTDYYSKADYDLAVENARQAQEESQRLAEEQQEAIDEQNKQWVDLEQSYYKLGQTLSKSTTSFDADGLRRGLDRVSQSIGDATTFLDELQSQADTLQSLQSSWGDFGTSIGDALTTLQRSGWGLSDYIAEYDAEMASLSFMVPGSQEALDASQKVLSLIGQISSLQTQTTETQASNLEQQEQEQEQALTSLKSSWASLQKSISSDITSQARSGWTSSDYLAEYQRQNVLLSSMDQGTQSALDTATSMLDLLKEIDSKQSEEVQAQESLNSNLLSIFSSVDSTLSSLQESSLAPVSSMEWYQQQYATLLTDATTAIQSGQDDAADEVQTFLDFAKTFLTYTQSYGGDYQSTYSKTTADISGLKSLSGYQLLSGGVVTDLDKLKASIASAGSSTSTLATKLGTSSGGLSSAAQQSSSFVQWLASYLAGGGSLSLVTASSTTSGLIQALSGQVSQLSASASVTSTSVTNAADGTSTLGSTLDNANGATFNAIAAYQALGTTASTMTQSVASDMTQLLNAINSAAAVVASQSGQTVNVTVSPVNAYTPTTHTTQETDWSWVQTGYRNNGVNPSTGMVDTYISGYWHTSHSPQYSGGWWVTTGRQPTHPDSYTYTYQAAEGGIARSTPGGLPVTVAEAGYDEMFVPLNREGVERATEGLGYGSDNIKTALKEAVQESLSPVLAALVEAINAGSGGAVYLDGQAVGRVVKKRLLGDGEFIGTLDRRRR